MTGGSDSSGGEQTASSVATWLALLSLALVPWVVIRTTGTTLLFPWGTVVLETGQVTPIWVFYEQPGPRPTELQYWPLGTLCYGLAVVWAGARTLGWNVDGRVTAGLVALVAMTAVVMAAGFGVDPNRTAYPVAAVHALGVAAWLWIGQSHLRRALEN
ncbi:TIGR04206 family protein [Natrialbaceae archaeon A-CW1-1]